MYKETLYSLEDLQKMGLMIEPKGSIVHNEIKPYIDKKGWSTTDLAEKTGISRQTLHNIINGSFTPGVDLALKLAKVLEQPVETLFQLKANAWYSRVKKSGDLTLYVDVIEKVIVDKEVMMMELKGEEMVYYDLQTKQMISDKEKKNLELQIMEEILQQEQKILMKAGDGEKDKRSLPRLAKELMEQQVEKRIVPKFQKLVRTVSFE